MNLYKFLQDANNDENVQTIFSSFLNKEFKVITHFPSKTIAGIFHLNIEDGDGLRLLIQYGHNDEGEVLPYYVDDFSMEKNKIPVLLSDKETELVTLFLEELLTIYRKNSAKIISGKAKSDVLKLTTSDLKRIEANYVKIKHQEKELCIKRLKEERKTPRWIYKTFGLYNIKALRKVFHAVLFTNL